MNHDNLDQRTNWSFEVMVLRILQEGPWSDEQSGVLQSWSRSLLLPIWFVQIAYKARCPIFSDSNHLFIQQALKLARAGLKVWQIRRRVRSFVFLSLEVVLFLFVIHRRDWGPAYNLKIIVLRWPCIWTAMFRDAGRLLLVADRTKATLPNKSR